MFQSDGKFHAHSGRTVRVGDDGTVMFDHANGYLSPQSAMDAEEFFQAKRDAELGRWRYPLEPDLLVYANLDDEVRVVDERTGSESGYFERGQWFGSGRFAGAAEAYYESHAARQPWHDAQEGEVWIITIKVTGNTYPAIFQADYFRDHGGSWSVQDITDAHRIWPATGPLPSSEIADAYASLGVRL